MSISVNFHTEMEKYCDVESRLIPPGGTEGVRDAYVYIGMRTPAGDLAMFFGDHYKLDALADKCREAAEFLRARPPKEVQS